MGSRQYPRHYELALGVVRSGLVPSQPARLTRRNRSIVLDADVLDGKHATVWIARRGHSGEPTDEFVHLERSNGDWRGHGGGGGSPGEDLEWRPTLAELQSSHHGRLHHTNPTFGSVGGGTMGNRRRDSCSTHMTLAAEVTELRFTDRPAKTVPRHGRVVVLTHGKRRVEVSAFDAGGTCLGSFRPTEYWKGGPPRFGPYRRWRLRGRRRGWFSYGSKARLIAE